VVIDDASRYAVVVPVADESGASAAHALEVAATEFAKLGIRTERVLTDNGWAYTRRPTIERCSIASEPATSAPDPGGPRPTARPSASFRP
jgi:transposase InsO family protein